MPTETRSSVEPPLVGAILAAGRGSRMGSRFDWLPKPLVPICGRPLIAHQMAILGRTGIRRIHVVVGHRKDRVIDYLETVGPPLELDISWVEQRELRGPGHALLGLEPVIRGPFVLFLGDIFILPLAFGDLAAPIVAGRRDAVLGVAEETDTARLALNYRVETDAFGTVERLIEKPRTPAPALKGTGVYAFGPAIFEAVRATAPGELGEIGITDAIQTLVDRGGSVGTAAVSRWDINLTRSDDVGCCEAHLSSTAAA